jgi:two-component system, cell cycle response regulator
MARILVVDDEIDTLNLLKIILEISGYQAVITLNSLDAINLAQLEQPDCILLDIMMPNLDGFTLCRMMRMHPATAQLPIIFVTAYPSLDLEDRRIQAGADMVLPKPVGMDTLIEGIQEAIRQRNNSNNNNNSSNISNNSGNNSNNGNSSAGDNPAPSPKPSL